MKRSIAMAACMSLPLISGCSEHVVISEAVSGSPKMRGLVYSLPKGQMSLTASRTPIGSDADIVKSKTEVAKAQAAVEKATKEKAAAKDDPVRLAAAELSLKTSSAALDAAEAGLKYQENNKNKWQEVVTLSALPIAPDPTARFVAEPDHQFTRDDTIKLSVVNGLLTSTKLTSADQTPNLIITLADTIITALNLPAAIPRPQNFVPASDDALQRPAPEPPATCPYSISEVFDPLNIEQLDKLNKRLRDRWAKIQVDIDALSALQDFTTVTSAKASDNMTSVDQTRNQDFRPRTAGSAPESEGVSGQSAGSDGLIGGLVYRVATPVVAKVIENGALKDKDACPLAVPISGQAFTTLVPDTRGSFIVSSKAGYFTTTNIDLGFNNGMLTDYSAHRPSELSAIASIPLTIANHIMTIPTQLLQLRVNYDTQATARVNSQTALKQAQIQRATTLTAAMTALINAQTALSTAQINQPGAVANAQFAVLQAQEALRKAIEAAGQNANP